MDHRRYRKDCLQFASGLKRAGRSSHRGRDKRAPKYASRKNIRNRKTAHGSSKKSDLLERTWPRGYWNGKEILPYPSEYCGSAKIWRSSRNDHVTATNRSPPVYSASPRSGDSYGSPSANPMPVLRIGVPPYCFEGPQVEVEGGKLKLEELPGYLAKLLRLPEAEIARLEGRQEDIASSVPSPALESSKPFDEFGHIAEKQQTTYSTSSGEHEEAAFHRTSQPVCEMGCNDGYGLLIQDLSLGASVEDVQHVFREYGQILTTVFTNLNWSASAKEMLIVYQDQVSVTDAVIAMDGVIADGRPIIVRAVEVKHFGGRWPRQQPCNACSKDY